jgi:CBS-domain-containing membrane protein
MRDSKTHRQELPGMSNFLGKLRSAGAARPARASTATIALAAAGGFIAIALLSLIGTSFAVNMLLGSFGASCVLVFGYPDVPFAQPANVIGGHCISAAIGLGVTHFCGDHAWSLALAVAAAIAAMMATRTVHPPAGSNPVIVFLSHPSWSFLLFPVLAGSLALVLVALVFNNSVRKNRYPAYW